MRVRRFLLLVILTACISLVGAYFWLFADLPSLEIAPNRLQAPSIRIVDRQNRLLYESLPSEGGRHATIPFKDIPLLLQQATIATEDAGFYTNPGIDLVGIFRAAWLNTRSGETVAGGSTLTQQVVRILLLSPEERSERSIRRKLREGFLAWQITRRYSKDEILALYLNQTYYGELAYGVEAAAQTYFGKPASDLDLAECALIAGLPQAPAVYDPYANPQAALERRDTVLGLMEKAGYISDLQHQTAGREPLNLIPTPYPMNAPHFSLMVRAQVEGLLSNESYRTSGGVTVHTTLDLDAQSAAQRAVERQVERLKEKGQSGLGYNVNNAAVVALDPRTGEILAMVGSREFNVVNIQGAINMALAPRQPGSALKPLIYAAAFDPSRPAPMTAASMLLDVTTSFITHDGKPYTPKNYNGQENGPVLARRALASSLNVPAVITLNQVGLTAFFEQSARLGIQFPEPLDQYDLSLALGGGEVRLLDLTSAYGVFANQGLRVQPFSIQSISDASGNILYQHTFSAPARILDDRVAWLISDILSDDDARLLGFPAHSALNIDRPAAVKTGTTTNFHDNWAIGYTPQLVVGVWVGNASHEAMRDVNGLTGAAPIWHQVMRDILANQPVQEFKRPEGLVQVEICALSGLLPTPDCPYRRMEWFIEGIQPAQPDNIYQKIEIDTASGLPANLDTPPERRQVVLVFHLPPTAYHWARSHNILLEDDLLARTGFQTSQPGSQPYAQPASLAILSPATGTTYQISPRLPASAQRITIEAVSQGDFQQVSLWMDNSLLAQIDAPPYRTFWQLSPGDHEIWAQGITPEGLTIASQRVSFTVIP